MLNDFVLFVLFIFISVMVLQFLVEKFEQYLYRDMQSSSQKYREAEARLELERLRQQSIRNSAEFERARRERVSRNRSTNLRVVSKERNEK